MMHGLRRTSDAGFTLVEVSVLLSVLVILSAMIAPVLSNTLSATRLAAAHNEMSVIAQALQQFLEDLGCEVVPQNTTGVSPIQGLVAAPTTQPPVAPPTGTSGAALQSLALAASTACTVASICDGPVVELLVSAGDIPAVGPGGDDDWALPPDGDEIDFLEFFLVTNTPGNDPGRAFPNPDDCGVVPDPLTGVRAWQGAYTGIGAGDPWGNRYMINTAFLVSGEIEDVVVLSAGPDEEVDTAFAQDGLVPGDDDLILLFNKGY